MVDVKVRLLDSGMSMPSYAHTGDAGADLASTIDVDIAPGQRVMVPTGVAFAIPDGYAGFVHPRSGLAARTGLTIVNTPGTLDSGYRGEVIVCLLNTDTHDSIHLARGDRIAQVVFQRVESARFVEVETLDETVRGVGGYGSTGGVSAWRNLEGAQER